MADYDSQRRAALEQRCAELLPRQTVNHIQVDEVIRWLSTEQREEQFVLVDVREPEERSVSYIPGSVTADEFLQQLTNSADSTNPYKNHVVIPYCTIGVRSGWFCDKLVQLGHFPSNQVRNLDGSILAYAHRLQELECLLTQKPEPTYKSLESAMLVNESGERTKKIHTFSSDWDLGPSSFQTEQFSGVTLIGKKLKLGYQSLF